MSVDNLHGLDNDHNENNKNNKVNAEEVTLRVRIMPTSDRSLYKAV